MSDPHSPRPETAVLRLTGEALDVLATEFPASGAADLACDFDEYQDFVVRADPAATLDAAWEEAEASLPDGWGIGIEPSARGYEAGAGRNQWAVWSGMAHPTPAAALLALAEQLRKRPPEPSR